MEDKKKDIKPFFNLWWIPGELEWTGALQRKCGNDASWFADANKADSFLVMSPQKSPPKQHWEPCQRCLDPGLFTHEAALAPGMVVYT